MIMRNNEIMRGATQGRGIRFVPDMFEISQAAGNDPRMLADDGLHPSGVQYGLWVDVIEPIVRELLTSVR